MNHNHNIIDADPFFEVNTTTRQIKNASPTKTTVIQYDHNSERFTFAVDRFVEGHDLTECSKIEVHYVNVDVPGVYTVTDIAIDSEDPNKAVCSWLLSANATGKAGLLSFLLRFSCVDVDGNITFAWSTGIFTGITVAQGMVNTEGIVEAYPDVLEQLKAELDKKIEGLQSGGGTVSQSPFIFYALINFYPGKGYAVTEFETSKNIEEAFNSGRMVIVNAQLVYWNEDGETEDIKTANLIATSPFTFFGVTGHSDHVFIEGSGDIWVVGVSEAISKRYIDTAIGDVEASLENIINKYGLGGDA